MVQQIEWKNKKGDGLWEELQERLTPEERERQRTMCFSVFNELFQDAKKRVRETPWGDEGQKPGAEAALGYKDGGLAFLERSKGVSVDLRTGKSLSGMEIPRVSK